jgi:hypothetical protein
MFGLSLGVKAILCWKQPLYNNIGAVGNYLTQLLETVRSTSPLPSTAVETVRSKIPLPSTAVALETGNRCKRCCQPHSGVDMSATRCITTNRPQHALYSRLLGPQGLVHMPSTHPYGMVPVPLQATASLTVDNKSCRVQGSGEFTTLVSSLLSLKSCDNLLQCPPAQSKTPGYATHKLTDEAGGVVPLCLPRTSCMALVGATWALPPWQWDTSEALEKVCAAYPLSHNKRQSTLGKRPNIIKARNTEVQCRCDCHCHCNLLEPVLVMCAIGSSKVQGLGTQTQAWSYVPWQAHTAHHVQAAHF